MADSSDPILPKRRRETPEVRQAAILDAALAEFAQHGFSDARMEDVARGARVSKGTVYLYYPTKTSLFEALVRRDIAPRVAVMASFLNSYDGQLEPALMRMAAMLGAIIDAGQLPIYPRLLVAEAARFPELVAFYRREVVGVMIAALSGLFARAMARGDIATLDPDMTAHLFIAPPLKSILWSLTFAATDEAPFRAQPYLEAHVRLFLRGLRSEETSHA